MRQTVRDGLLAAALTLTLSGCMADGLPFGQDKPETVTRAQSAGAFADAQDERSEDNRSTTIDALIARRSVLPQGSPYEKVANATLAASARTAEAELRQARLRSRAADKNWLPSLGPSVSLMSLSSIVASLVVDQVLFDHGRKKAEREFARADVEAAAVALSQDQNDRVHEALSLYLKAEEARETAAASAGALTRMREMEAIMAKRVEGGISDMSELAVIRSKVAELASTRENALQIVRTARAELNAMSAAPLDDVHGTAEIAADTTGIDPLSLHLALTERDRDIAQAAIARAGLLPGISAGAVLSSRDGLNGPNVQLSSDAGFGFSTPDNLRAVEASKEAAERRVTQAREDTNRRLAALTEERAGLVRRAARAVDLASQGQANANLFKRQFEAGTRTVSEVVTVIETMARLQTEAISTKYSAARTDIEIARELGVLADGASI
ncbi:TolC family protein [Maritimibacter sp. UBA3975]|uniref:TolC family protein n=1 Tax=Maritimibacter sp. UBA3975 TaxID=1946833 RepID=UPI0025C109C1|nr:TolC family protein [Maritimibacter sp. UBA3975]